jgi:hypothetical protein
MNVPTSPRLVSLFLRIAGAALIVALFCILTVAGVYGATRIPTDPAIERLVVAGDPQRRPRSNSSGCFPKASRRF